MSRAPRGATVAAIGLLLLLLGAAAGTVWLLARDRGSDDGSVRIKLRLPGAREAVRLGPGADGRLEYLVEGESGLERLSPDALARRLYDHERSRDWLAVLLNITTPAGIAWVALGLLGQLLFTGRMLVQWLHSERIGRSEVPPIFWWFSIVGAAMLLTYFLWRTDIVGIIGQGLGFVIYARNLMLLRRGREG